MPSRKRPWDRRHPGAGPGGFPGYLRGALAVAAALGGLTTMAAGCGAGAPAAGGSSPRPGWVVPGAAPGPDGRVQGLRPCGPPEAIGRVRDEAVTETSGLIRSRHHGDLLWLHNDSGDVARLFAVDPAGGTRGVTLLPQTPAFDWEGMARGPLRPNGPEGLFVADFGDNHHERPFIVIERLAEPGLGGTAAAPRVGDEPDHLRFTYGDGRRHDAEALIVDRPSGDLYVLTKEFEDRPGIFHAEAPHPASRGLLGRRQAPPRVLEQVGEVALPPDAGSHLVTDAALSDAGDGVLVRTYEDVFFFTRRSGEPLEAALDRPPVSWPAPEERQGEAITFVADPPGYATISEGVHPTIWRVRLCPPGGEPEDGLADTPDQVADDV